MEVAESNVNNDGIYFTHNEWKHFVAEVEMRQGKEISKCINNARYLAMLDISDEQIKKGQVVMKTVADLEAME